MISQQESKGNFEDYPYPEKETTLLGGSDRGKFTCQQRRTHFSRGGGGGESEIWIINKVRTGKQLGIR